MSAGTPAPRSTAFHFDPTERIAGIPAWALSVALAAGVGVLWWWHGRTAAAGAAQGAVTTPGGTPTDQQQQLAAKGKDAPRGGRHQAGGGGAHPLDPPAGLQAEQFGGVYQLAAPRVSSGRTTTVSEGAASAFVPAQTPEVVL